MPRVREFTVTTERRTQIVDITDRVREALGDPGDAAALCVFVPHVTAGVIVQETNDPKVATDLEMAFERIVEDGWPWEHFEVGEVNPWSHARASLTASSVVIPLAGGVPALGTWQRIMLADFDGPRTRRVLVQPLR
jgi:secondary thiamine-phosphate synthase enzyme